MQRAKSGHTKQPSAKWVYVCVCMLGTVTVIVIVIVTVCQKETQWHNDRRLAQKGNKSDETGQMKKMTIKKK